jgi:glycine/D-amino acid oxidase-like deaminating enzyme
MSDESKTVPPDRLPEDVDPVGLPRRDFFKVAGASAGALIVGGSALSEPRGVPGIVPDGLGAVAVHTTAASEIVVIGAGGWGAFTALELRKKGLSVTLVDAYGPGNARSTSGDETRGVRSSYGDRTGIQGEVWTSWARESMKKWVAFDDEWGKQFRLNVYHTTGDLIMRTDWDNFQLRTKVLWDKLKIPYNVLSPADVKKSFPVMQIDDITAILYEPDAGVVRARRATQAAANAFEVLGGKIVIGRATPGEVVGGQLKEVKLDTGQTIRGDTFVFAVGPWLGKTFPEIFAKKTRLPIGTVIYFATPVGDHRFTYPNLPSWNFPGVTGWAALPVDNRGFRVRGTERAPTPPPTAADSAAAIARGVPPTFGLAADSTGGRGGRGAPGDSTAGRGGRGAAGDSTAGRGGRGGRGGAAGQGGGRGGQPQPEVPSAQQDPDTSDRWADATRVEGSRRFVARRFPLLATAAVAQTHACHYESTSSNNFVIDKHPGMSNVWIAAGGNAEGFKQCPVIGEYVSQRVMGVEGDANVAKSFRIPEKDYDPPAPPPGTTADSTKKPPPPPLR